MLPEKRRAAANICFAAAQFYCVGGIMGEMLAVEELHVAFGISYKVSAEFVDNSP